jgi:hypothetical protein
MATAAEERNRKFLKKNFFNQCTENFRELFTFHYLKLNKKIYNIIYN